MSTGFLQNTLRKTLLKNKGPYLLAAGLTGLLVLLAFLQHRWLVQVSEAERERARAHVRSAAAAFARDFNEPLSRLAFDFLPLFQLPQDQAALAELLAGRLERWRSTTTDPDLMKSLWILDLNEEATFALRRLDEKTSAFEPMATVPPQLQGLVSRLTDRAAADAGDDGSAPPGRFLRRLYENGELEPLDEKIPALLLPLPRRGQTGSAPAWLFLELDREVLQERRLARLAAEYFPEASFGLRVVSKADPSQPIFEAGQTLPKDGKIEVEAELFGPLVFARPPAPAGPVFEIPLAMRSAPAPAAPLPPVDPPEQVDPPGPDRAPLATSAPAPPATPATPSPPSAPFPPPADRLFWTSRFDAPGSPMGEGRWRLLVFHEAGSLDAAVDAAQRRNLSIAFGILLVLGSSILFLAKAAAKAQDLARRQMELVAGVTHELLTPLAAMKSAGQNLRDGVVQEGPKVVRYGELIVKESDRLSGLVGQVLLWAGLSSQNTGGLRRERLDAVELAKAALEELKPGLETAHFEVELLTESDLPSLSGDAAALRQALSNLIANAIKYGRPAAGPPWLQVTVRRAVRREKGGNQVVFTVADRGEGIAAEDLPHLFEPFYRGRKVVASTLAGAGLGLALVRRIAEAHGGEVRVESVPGRGTTFTLCLPAASGDLP